MSTVADGGKVNGLVIVGVVVGVVIFYVSRFVCLILLSMN